MAYYLRDAQITNVVSFAGDFHAHFASLVYDDYDSDSPRAQMAEFVTASISSMSQFAAVEQLARREAVDATEEILRSLITYDARAATQPGTDARVVNLNTTLRFGSRATVAVARDNTQAAIDDNTDPSVNPHLRYADTAAHGFGVVRVTADEITTQLVAIDSIVVDSADGPAVLRRATFVVPHAAPGDESTMALPAVAGQAPFPLSLGVT